MLEGLTPATHERKCLVTKVAESLDKDDAKILNDALADQGKWSSNALSEALGKRGVKLGDSTIRKHRDKMCLCFRI